MRLWLAAAFLLAATTATGETGKVGPPKSEFRDGPFFVSWRYVTQNVGMVYATPKLPSSDPLRFTVGEVFEVSVTLRVPQKGTDNPCVDANGNNPCDMEANLIMLDAQGRERKLLVWRQNGILKVGLDTFSLQSRLPSDVTESRGYIDFQVKKEGRLILSVNAFPFRVNRP